MKAEDAHRAHLLVEALDGWADLVEGATDRDTGNYDFVGFELGFWRCSSSGADGIATVIIDPDTGAALLPAIKAAIIAELQRLGVEPPAGTEPRI